MNAPVHALPDEIWISLCEADPVRPSFVAAGRARLAADDWPSPLDVADALLGWPLRLPVLTA